MAEFAQLLPHPQFLVPPSIDPLSEKNRDLEPSEIEAVRAEYGLDPSRPLLVQVSRFDRFKDPVGVIAAYRMVRKVAPVQLVLAGGGATDDPEGKAVLDDVMEAAGNDPDIHVLLLPPDAHRTINALQRLADVVIQKSTKEGFGLTVTEGMWKGKPVVGRGRGRDPPPGGEPPHRVPGEHPGRGGAPDPVFPAQPGPDRARWDRSRASWSARTSC